MQSDDEVRHGLSTYDAGFRPPRTVRYTSPAQWFFLIVPALLIGSGTLLMLYALLVMP